MNSTKKGCVIMNHTIDSKTLGDIFQEIIVKFSQMQPTSLDELENETLNAIRRIGKGLMQWKFQEWDSELAQETCPECGGKQENRSRSTQIATWVTDISYDRCRINCTNCGRIEYPLDTALGLRPRQQYSSSVEEMAVLCGASWKYQEAEYMMQKILRRPCLCHETVFNKTNEVGEAASMETDGIRIKALEDDKRLQGEYFDNMEVCQEPPERIYMDMDGVMINSRDNSQRMEGKVAVVWSDRELVKSDAHGDTYSLTDKRAMGTFTDTESFYWDITAEVYKRSGGRMDEVDSLVRGDGAPFIRGFRSKYTPRSRYILDHHHLCEKVEERLSSVFAEKQKRQQAQDDILTLLNSGDVDGALEYIQRLMKRFRKQSKLDALKRLSGYIQRNREGIWYDAAREQGISIGAGSVEKAGDILICRRMKLRGMRWSRKGADAVLSIRILVYNKQWDDFWKRYNAA
jgi:hypothetical protein